MQLSDVTRAAFANFGPVCGSTNPKTHCPGNKWTFQGPQIQISADPYVSVARVKAAKVKTITQISKMGMKLSWQERLIRKLFKGVFGRFERFRSSHNKNTTLPTHKTPKPTSPLVEVSQSALD